MTVLIVVGGIGLFLLGMILMTDGLKTLAGDSLKRILSKFTGGTWTSIGTGTIITAIMQSSSATTLMTIGFVSAGLLTFYQSIGVIIGANLGSTTIGWIVSVVGFKLSMNTLAMPLVAVGALIRFLGKGKYNSHGLSIAGFGLLFLGIGTLQEGMAVITERFSFAEFAGTTFSQKLLLIIIGIVMTVLMQSSSAAVVVTLSALATGAVTFEQAALLGIGQNVGTSIKALFASMAGTVAAKRTAIAHISFNVICAVIAFTFLGWLISFVHWLGSVIGVVDETVMLALYHTVFYIIGMLLVVPFIHVFANLIVRMIPERHEQRNLTAYLDPSVATVGAVATEAVRRTLIEVLKVLSSFIDQWLESEEMTDQMEYDRTACKEAIAEVSKFMAQISDESFAPTTKSYYEQVALLHVLDHLTRLLNQINEPKHKVTAYQKMDWFVEVGQFLAKLEAEMSDKQLADLAETLRVQSANMAEARKAFRKETIELTALNPAEVNRAIEHVDFLHWIDSIVYHIWRSVYHLERMDQSEGMPEVSGEYSGE